MTPVQSPSQLQRSRKPSKTYSLAVDGDAFRLTNIAAAPLTKPVATRSSPPLVSPSQDRHILTHNTFPVFLSSSHPYIPCLPVPRGPRSTNLYLYQPTAADYAKAERRSALKTAAIEQARKEREDDERRRNAMLGIAVPRKSPRKAKAKGKVAGIPDGLTGVTERSVIMGDDAMSRKDHRVASATKSLVAGSDLDGDTSTSTSGALIQNVFVSPSLDPTLPANKPRRKPQPKMNQRPTERLTTRSLAKAKATSSGVDTCSGPPSEAGDVESMEIDIETEDSAHATSNTSLCPQPQVSIQNPNFQISEQTSAETVVSKNSPAEESSFAEEPSLQRSSYRRGHSNGGSKNTNGSPVPQASRKGRKRGAFLGTAAYLITSGGRLGHGPSPLSQAHFFEHDAEATEVPQSSSEGISSAEIIRNGTGTMHDTDEMSIHVITPQTSSQSSATSPTPPGDRSVSPAVSSLFSTATKGNKRKLEDLDSNAPLQTPARRSSRIPKKRKMS